MEITHDTTYVHCIYQAEKHSWASLSDKTYLETIKEGTKYPILKVYGSPFSPEQRTFENDTLIYVSLCFPKVNSSNFNLIEDEINNGFNIYGININKTYSAKYSYEQYVSCGIKAYQLDSLGRTDEAIEYKKKQLEMAKFLYGEQSYECAAAQTSLDQLLKREMELNPARSQNLCLAVRPSDVTVHLPSPVADGPSLCQLPLFAQLHQ